MDAYRSLLPCAAAALRDEGRIVVEIGIGQRVGVSSIAGAAGLEMAAVKCDLSGVERAVALRKKGLELTGPAANVPM